jgi:hypothetical protein
MPGVLGTPVERRQIRAIVMALRTRECEASPTFVGKIARVACIEPSQRRVARFLDIAMRTLSTAAIKASKFGSALRTKISVTRRDIGVPW